VAEHEKRLVHVDWHIEVEEPHTCCKHGWYDCVVCGTNNRTDRIHVTVNGQGTVARALGRRQPNKG
jgi:hypothetical protein